MEKEIREYYNKSIDKTWWDFFDKFDITNFEEMIKALSSLKISGKIIYPEFEDIFKAFFYCPKDKFKVVVLGLSPYHDSSGIGIAFANRIGTTNLSPSLKILHEELMDTGLGRIHSGNCDLVEWCKQGVLLINSSLTVEKGKPKSHLDIWKWFIKDLITRLAEEEGYVFVFMGSEAKSFNTYIKDNVKNICINVVHPAADLHHNSYKFRGSDCFRMINEALISQNKKEIIW